MRVSNGPLGARWLLPLTAAGLLGLTGAAYAGRLAGPFMFDDQAAIVENATLRQLDWGVLAPPRETPVAGRPLVNLTFALDFAVSDLSAAAFHRSNLALHVACSLMLLLFLRRALRAPRMPVRVQAHAELYAGLTALLFCVHPLASELVLYTSQRTELLVALCYLATLDAVACAAVPETGSSPGRRLWLAVLGIGLCGAASKEVFVTAPFVALCFDRAFCAGSFRQAWRAHKALYLALLPSLALLGLLQLSQPRPGSVRCFELEYLLAQAEIVPRYFGVALWPSRLTLDYGPLWPGSRPPAWPWLVGSALALAGSVALIRTRPRLGFLPLFILSYLAPSSSLLSIHTELGAERRFYLPLAALLGYLVVAAGELCVRSWQRRSVRLLACAAIACAALALGLRTRARALDYASLRRVWQVAVQARPSNARAHYNLAETYRREGDPSAAIAAYEAALAVHEAYPDAHSNLGGVLLGRGETERGLRHTARAAQLAPDSAQVRMNNGIALGIAGHASGAVDELRAASSLRPQDLELRVKLATALAIAGQLGEARAIAQRVLSQAPGHRAADRILRKLD